MRELRHRHPDADVHVQHVGWDDPRTVLFEHRADAVVTRLPFPTDGLRVTILYDEPRALLVPREHRLAGKGSITLGDIARELPTSRTSRTGSRPSHPDRASSSSRQVSVVSGPI